MYAIFLFRVLVLDKGKVVEYDTPGHLLADTTSIFNSMANAQTYWYVYKSDERLNCTVYVMCSDALYSGLFFQFGSFTDPQNNHKPS